MQIQLHLWFFRSCFHYSFRRRSLRVRFPKKIQDWVLKSKNGFCISLLNRWIQDHSDMVHQRNQILAHPYQRILAQSGFFGSFDTLWSEWSWIDLFSKDNLFSDSFGLKNPITGILNEAPSVCKPAPIGLCKFWATFGVWIWLDSRGAKELVNHSWWNV